MRAKLEVSYVFYAFFILKQKNVKYGVFYYFSAISFNYALFDFILLRINILMILFIFVFSVIYTLLDAG